MRWLQRMRKFLSFFTSLILVSTSILQPLAILAPQAIAQEDLTTLQVSPTTTANPTVTPEATPTETIAPTPSETPAPTPLSSASPTVTPEPTETPTPTPTTGETVTPSPTSQPTPTPTEPPKETDPPDEGQILDGVSTTATSEQGELHTVILKNVEAVSLNLDSIDPSTSATLTTDKADYAPTDTALISGSGLTPNTSYSLTVSSADDPATTTTVQITTETDGTFVYAYQLDGTYRPNYTVKVTDSAGIVVATTTFTDASRIASVSGNWNNTATWGGASVPTSADSASINSGVTVTVTASTSITNLTLSAATSKLIINSGQTLTVAGTFSNSGTTTNGVNGPGTILFTGTTSFGSFTPTGTRPHVTVGDGTSTNTVTVGANTLVANLTVNANATLTNTTRTVGANGNLSVNGTLTAGTGVYTLSGATKTISGTTSIPSVAITGTYTNNGTLTVGAALSGAGTLTNGATGVLNIGGPTTTAITLTNLTATAVGNTIHYTGAAQTGKVATYHNLTLSGSGIKRFATTPTVNGILSLEGTATVVATSGVVTYGPNATLQYNTATARTVSTEEWITPFAATGGVIIANTGTITVNAAKVFNASIPLTINSGATLATGNFPLTFGGNFVRNGTLTGGSSPIVIANTMATQSIDGFTTTGLVSMTKTAGTATFTDNVNGNGLTINGSGGTLHLGTGLSHTFTGAWTRTAGTLNGGSSILKIGGSVSGSTGTFTAGTGTVEWNAAGVQTLAAVTYNNLSLSGNGAKTIATGTTVGENISISGTATGTLTNGSNTTAGSLTLGGVNKASGTWGSTSSTATHKNSTYFPTANTGVITVATGPAANSVTNVTSTLANGSYTVGQIVPVTVTFSGNVTVMGAPQITLSTGSPATTAVNYSSGSGTTTLTFDYTVAAGNTSADLNYTSTGALALNGGTIKDVADNTPTLTLPATGGAGSLGANKNIVIDTTSPGGTISLGTPTISDGDLIQEVTINYNEAMDPAFFPTVALGNGTWTPLVGSFTTSTQWTQNVTLTDLDETYSAVTATSTGAKDLAGNSEVTSTATFAIDTENPTLSTLTFVSDNANPVYAKEGDTIALHFFSSEPVTPPTVLIAGHAVTATNNLPLNGNEWTATYLMVAGDAEGTVAFSINYLDAVGNAGTEVTNTTSGQNVFYDRTNPTDPTASSTSHTTSLWSNDPTVTMTWSGAGDGTGSGVDGFYTEWNTSPTAVTGPVTREYVATGNSETSPSLLDGSTHFFHVATVDKAGNWTGTEHIGPFYVDSTVPTDPGTPTTTPTSPTNQTSITWSWTDTDAAVSGLKQYIWNLWESVTTFIAGGTTTNTNQTTVISSGDGNYTFDIRAEDNAGNQSGTALSANLHLDTAKPVSSVSSPAYDNGGTIPVDFTAADEPGGSGVASTVLWYRVDTGSGFGTWTTSGLAPLTGSSGTFAFNPAGADGTYEFYSVATDNANNTENAPIAADDATMYDDTEPSSTITTPTNTGSGSTVYTNSWDGSLAGGATDTLSGIDKVWLSLHRATDDTYWNGVNWGAGTESSVRVQATGTTGWTYGLTSPLDDTYIVKSHAQDAAGNLETTYMLTIVLDRINPTASLTIDPTIGDASNGWYKTEPTITLTGADDVLLNRVEYQYDSSTGTWTTYTSAFKTPGEGAHILYYRAWDEAGNVSTLYSKDIKYDKTAPSKGPQNISISPNPSNGNNIKVKWDAATDNVGIDHYSVSWKKDGVSEKSADVSEATREYTIPDNLTAGDWTVKVTAYDAAGFSADVTTTATVDKAGPLAPTLTLTGTGVGTVSLAWNTISDAVDYSVWYGVSPGSYLYAAHVGTTTSYTISGLGSGTYYVVVAAYDSTGNRGGFSNEVSTGTTITGAPGAAVGPAEGFLPASEVLGSATPSAESVPASPSGVILGSAVPGWVVPSWLLSALAGGLPFSVFYWLIVYFW